MSCKFRLYILIKSILGAENWWLPWFFVCFSDMCYHSSSSPQILIVNNSSFEHNWRCSMYNNFSNLYLEQVLVHELKNSWVDSWVSNWSNWFPGGADLLGSSRTTVAVAVWKGFAKEMRPRWWLWEIATQIWLDGQILCNNQWCAVLPVIGFGFCLNQRI